MDCLTQLTWPFMPRWVCFDLVACVHVNGLVPMTWIFGWLNTDRVYSYVLDIILALHAVINFASDVKLVKYFSRQSNLSFRASEYWIRYAWKKTVDGFHFGRPVFCSGRPDWNNDFGSKKPVDGQQPPHNAKEAVSSWSWFEWIHAFDKFWEEEGIPLIPQAEEKWKVFIRKHCLPSDCSI